MLNYFFRNQDDFTSFNAGYADRDMYDGLILEGHPRNMLDRYRLQLYHYLVVRLGKIESMEGKSLVETGCGRGGGLKYLAEKLKPRYAIGVDINPS